MTERETPAAGLAERETLEAFLDYHRATLAWKCEGLDAEQLARRASPPSELSLLGLVRHMADVERAWFDRVAARHRPHYYFDGSEGFAFRGAVADPDVVARAFADWHEAVEEGKTVLAGVGLEDWFESKYGPLTIRWLFGHLIEEYARHNGHADLLREAIDGMTGE